MRSLFWQVQRIYTTQFWEWFAITAPTSVLAALVLVFTDQRVRAIFASVPRGTIQTHPLEIAEAGALRFGGFFVAWLLGCFALGAIATIVSHLDAEDEDNALRDSHQRAREHFGVLFGIAIVTFIMFLLGLALATIITLAISRVFGWVHVARYYFFAALIGYLVVASIVSWFGMAIPLALRGNTRLWTALKKSLEAADGYQGFLFLLAIQSLVGSYVAWYTTTYALFAVVPPQIKAWAWYGWGQLLVITLASAALEPPILIGFSLLAEEGLRAPADTPFIEVS